MSGSTLHKRIVALGLTVAEFSRLSGISVPTLTKIFADEHVRESSRNKAIVALERVQKELTAPTTRKTAAAV